MRNPAQVTQVLAPAHGDKGPVYPLQGVQTLATRGPTKTHRHLKD